MHMLYEPDCFEEGDASILDLLPRRTRGELQVTGTPVEGWGIYYQERQDISSTLGTMFTVFFLASLLFLVLWTVFKGDIQGGSGVSAYIIAVASMLGIWVAARNGSFE
jgi:hypothetical protein